MATIVHTSGTTGNPKGVVLTHGNILHNYEAGIQAVDFNENDLFLSFLPLSHMTERAAGQIVPLGRGCTIAYAEPAIERLAANMVGDQADRHGRRPAPVRAALRPGHLDGRGGPGPAPADLRLGAGPGREPSTQNHLAGQPDSAWLRLQMRVADRLVFHKIRARHRRARALLRLRAARRCRGRSASSSTPWGC